MIHFIPPPHYLQLCGVTPPKVKLPESNSFSAIDACKGKISPKNIEMSVFDDESDCIQLVRTYSMRSGDIANNIAHKPPAVTMIHAVRDTIMEFLNLSSKIKWSENLTQVYETYSSDEYDRKPLSMAERIMMRRRDQFDNELAHATTIIQTYFDEKISIRFIAKTARNRYLRLYSRRLC